MRGFSRRELAPRGRAARKQVSRRSHAGCPLAKHRADALSILAGQDATRIPELLGLRYAQMSVSPFTFLRGSAAVMAADLSCTLTMQTVSDIFLGWLRAVGPNGVERDFYVRQFRDMKGSVDGTLRIEVPGRPLS